MAAVSRIRDPQRLVELVADTMFAESRHASRTRRVPLPDGDRADDSPVERSDSSGESDADIAA
jgi:hypothetical protein